MGRNLRFLILFLMVALGAYKTQAQTQVYTSGALTVEVTPKHPCDGLNNGSVVFRVVSTNAGSNANIFLQFFPFSTTSVAPGATFTFNNSGAGMAGGNYGFFIFDNATSVNPSVALTPIPTPLTDGGATVIVPNGPTCGDNNGSVTLNISGGSGFYSYLWDDNSTGSARTGLDGGTYNVTVTDDRSNCTLDLSYYVPDPEPADFTISTSTPVVCSEDNITISTVGAAQSGVTFQLQVAGTDVLAPQVGNGTNPITFTLPTSAYASGQNIQVLATLVPCVPKLSTNTITVTENPLPTASISGTTTICVGGSATLTFALPAGTYDLVYTDGVSNFPLNGISNGATVNVSPTANTTYSIVSVTNTATLCDVTAPHANITGSAVITVNPLPTASISGTTTICTGGSAALTFTLSPGTYNVVYTDGSTNFNLNGISSGATTSVSPTANTTYTIVSITNTSTPSCTVTAPHVNLTGSAVVTVNPLPTASISGTTTICNGGSATLTFTLSAGTYNVVYTDGTSNFTLNGISTGATTTVSPTANTTYTIVSITNTATASCTVTAPHANLTGSAVVTVNPLPTASISGTSAVCSGGSATLTFTLSAGTYNVVYTDGSSNFTLNGITNGHTVNVSPTANTTYTIVSIANTAIASCAVTAPHANITGSAVITVNPLPTASIGTSATICTGGSATLTFTLPATGTYNVVYTDGVTNFPVNGISNGATVNVSPTANTTYTIVNVTNATTLCGVTAPHANITGSAVITVNPLPTASISGTTTICNGGSATLTFTLSAGTYNVVYTDGTSNFTLNGISSGATTNVSPTANTTYTIVSITNTVTASCTVTAPHVNLTGSAVVTVNPLPTASISGTSAVCNGASATLTFTLSAGTYNVVYTDGTSNFTLNGITNGHTVNVSPTANTTYTIVSIANTAIASCAVTAPHANITGSAVITVNPLPTASISGTTTICTGGSATLTFTLPATGTYNVVYTDGVTNFPLGGITNGHTVNVSPTANTTYTIAAVGNATTLCGITAPHANITGSAAITVNSLPTASISGTTTICNGGSATLTFTLSAGTYNVVYTDGSSNFTLNGISSGATANVSPTANTTYTIVSITNTATASCTVTAPHANLTGSAVVTVNPLPTASISGTTTICTGGSATLTFTLSAGTYNVVYTDGSSNFTLNGITNGHTVNVSPTANTTYTIVSITNTSIASCAVTAPHANITGSAVITVSSLPTASISGTTTICTGGSATLTFTLPATGTYNVVYTDGVSNFNLNAISNGATANVTPTANTTYTIVSVTSTAAASCAVTAPHANITGSAVITVNPLPTASISGTATICNGGSATLTFTLSAGTYNVVYTDGTSNFTLNSISSGATTNVSPTANTTYTIVSITNTAAASCAVTAPHANITGSAVITVNPLPTAAISGTTTICTGGSATLTFTLSAGTYDVVYTDGSSNFTLNGITSGATVNVSPTAITTYTIVSIANTSIATCAVTAPHANITGSAVVTVNPLPTASISGTTTICTGASATLAFTLSAGSYDVVYTDGVSNFTLNGISSGATVNVTPTASTTYTIVSVTNTATASCTVTAPHANITGSAVITVNPLPTASISGTNTICGGASATLTFTLSAGTYNVVYTDGVSNFTANNISSGATVNVSPTASRTYTIVSITNTAAASCAVTAPHANITGSAVITVNPLPVGNISGTATICTGGNATLTFALSASTHNVVYTDGTSNFTLNGIANGATVSVSPATTTTYTIVSITNATTLCGVTAPHANITGSAVITVNAPPDAAASGTTVCSGTATNISITSPNGLATSFSWVIQNNPGGVTGAVAGTGTTIAQTLVNPTATDQTVTYRITPHATACDGTPIDINVVVTPAPDAGTNGSGIACNTETAFDLFAELGGTPDTGGAWTDLDTSGGAITGDAVNLTAVTPGNYRFRYTVTGTAPCANATAIVTVTVVNGTPDPGSNNIVSACNNITALNLFTSLGGTPDAGGTWTDLDASGAVITGNNADLTPITTAGAYRFRYRVTAGSCGTASAIVTVNVSLSPNAGTTGSLAQVCNNATTFDLLAAMGGSPDNGGTWTDVDNSGAVISGNNADFSGVVSDSYFFRYSITVGSCTDMAILIVEVTDAPDAGADDATSACNTETAFDLFAALGGTPATNGTWTDLDASGGVMSGNNINLTTVAPNTYRFRYTVTGTAPCANASAIVTLTVVNGTPDAGSDNTVSACNNDTSFDLLGSLGGTPDAGGTWADDDNSSGVISGNTIDLTGVTAGPYDFTYTVTLAGCGTASATVTVNVSDAPNAGTGGSTTVCNTETALDLFNLLGGSPDGGGTWAELDGSGAVRTGNLLNLNGVSNGAYRFEYTVDGTGGCADATAIVTVNVRKAPNAGTAGAATVCNTETAFNLLSELGGTPDSGGTWTDLDASGGVITVNAVNLTGVTTPGNYRFRYTVTGTAPCANATAIVTLTVVNGSPDAGADNTVDACNANTALDLFASLGGTPDGGGTWSDDDSSGGVLTGNNIDLTGVTAGAYDFTYTVTVAGCGTASATVTVNVTDPPDAGADNTANICSSETAFDLRANLGGSPDNGGTWTDLDNTGAVITANAANFNGVDGGTYDFQYTVAGAPGCADVTSILTVTVTEAPDAGLPNSVTACTSETAFDLFGSLDGTPDGSGTWADLDGSGVTLGNTIDLSGVTPGNTYRFEYTVGGTAPCANATAIVSVNVINIAPDAGSDNSVQACNDDTAFDLFASLGGSPDPGGTWSDDNGSGGVITGDDINLAGVAAATSYNFTYTITVPGCGTASATVTVAVSDAPDAGTDNTVTTCVDDASFDLFAALGGTPDTGGTWVDVDLTGAGITSAGIADFSGIAPGTYDFEYTVNGPGGCADATAVVTVTIGGRPVPTINTSNAACNGTNNGSITITSVAGGVTPYQYSINNGTSFQASNSFTALAAGNYTVIVRDNNGCESDPVPVTVSASVTIIPTIAKTDAACTGVNNGVITVTAVMGGLAPYQYSKDNGATFQASNVFNTLEAGSNHTIVVRDANGCLSSVSSIIINSGTTISATIDKTDASSCAGTNGSITVTSPTGGAAPYEYSIDDGTTFQSGGTFNPIAQGTYEVVIRDNNGCMSSAVTINVGTVSGIVPVIAKVDAGCNGLSNGSITVTSVAGGLAPYTYSKDNGVTFQPGNAFTNLAAGSYAIVVRDAALCLSSVATISVNNGAIISGTIDKTDASSCAGTNGSITITLPTGGTGPYEYSNDNGTSFQGSGIFSPLAQGTYQVVIRDANGCLSSTTTVNVGTVSGILPVISKVDAGCNGLSNGSITVTGVTGGLAPYMYSNDNGVTFQAGNSFPNLAAGNYAIVVRDAALCVSSVATISVNNGATISGTIDKTDASSCAGTNGSITITLPTGGAGPYEYSSDGGTTFQGSGVFSPLAQGTYQVVIRDANGCLSSTTTVNVGTVSGILPVIAKVDAGCNGLSNGSITVTGVTGGLAPYTYSKDNGVTFQAGNAFTNLAAGNYAIVVRDAALCVSSVATISVNNGATISGTIDKTDASACAGTNGAITITLPTGGTGPYEYSSDGGTTFQGSGVFSPLAQGTYQVVIRDANGCLSSTTTVNIGTGGGIQPVIAKTDASCNGQSDGSITVTSVTGGLAPYSYSKDNGATFQPGNAFPNLASGNYAIIVRDASLCVSSVFTIAISNGVTISASINKTDETCTPGGDGEISITSPTGGATPYQFSIDNGTTFQASGTFENLALGVYSVVIRDNNGCMSSAVMTAISKPSNCSGGGTGLCSTVVIIPDPSPAQCTLSNGSITFRIRPFTPAVNNAGVKISIVGTSTTNQTIARTQYNDSVFTALPIGTYAYAIEYGDVSCTKTGQVTVDQSGTVGTPSASNVIGPVCSGAATGSIILNVPGETGNILEWSLDAGITDPFKPFVAGGLVSGIPAGPAPSFERVISVRRNAADPCYASVRVTIQDANPALAATFNITAATCSGNDGAISDIAASGGSGTGYQFSIDGGVNFQAGTSFGNLTGGAYILKVRDGLGCEKDINVNVTFPGFINATITPFDASCSNNATSGAITVTITDPGAFRVALSTDQFNEPADADYQNYQSPSVTFNDLSRDQYFVYMKSTAAACPTRSAPVNIGGAFALSFDMEPRCSGTDLSVALTNIVGDPAGAFEVWVYRKFTNVVVEKIQPGAIPVTGSLFLPGADHPFLTTADEYQLQMVQISPSAFCEIRSPLVDFTTPETLYAPIATTEESYPDIPTGSIRFTNFEGGTTAYEIRIELDSAASPALPFFETTWEEVTVNKDQRYEKMYKSVPPGRYIVQVTDAFGCSVERIARVRMDKDIFIPNIFTPNDDDINDVFFVRNLPQDSEVKLVITNRWGKSVYTNERYKNDWKGEGAVDGVYFYQLQVNGSEARTGWVEILRGQKP